MIKVSEKEVSVVTIKLDSNTAHILYCLLGKATGSGKHLAKMELLEEELSDYTSYTSAPCGYSMTGKVTFKEDNDD